MDTAIQNCVIGKWNGDKNIKFMSDEEQIAFLINALKECGYDKPDLEGQGEEMLRYIRGSALMSSD